MHTVAQLLAHKGYEIWDIGPDESVFKALETMAKHDVGALVVMEGGKLCGIVSERDYARKVILEGKRSEDTKVRDIMTRKVVCTTLEHTVPECFALMTEKRIRHLPVIDHKKVVAILSIGDCVKATIQEQQFVIQQLENYISGIPH